MYAYFGSAVALSGDYMVVGAPNEDKDAQGLNPVSLAGAAYVFQRQPNGDWQQTAKLVLSDRQPNERFGNQVAISGSTILVSAPLYESPGLSRHGRVICFDRASDGRWWRTDSVYPFDTGGGNFGSKLALDGNAAVIGMSLLWPYGGPVYVYHRTGSWLAWDLQAQLTPVDGIDYGYPTTTFGSSLSIWQKRIAVGSWSDNLPDNGRPERPGSRGAVYLFDFNDGDGQWHRTAKIRPTKQISSEAWYGFGYQVSVFRDRCLITSGYPYYDPITSRFYEAYIFHRQKTGNWAFEAQLTSVPAFASTRNYLLSAALTDSFALLGIGSNDSDASGDFVQSGMGAAHLFQRTDTTWHHTAKLIPYDAPSPGSFGGEFGGAVALSAQEAVIGAARESRDSYGLAPLSYAGAAYVANLGGVSKLGSGRIGAEPLANKRQWQVSPNPVSHTLTIRLQATADEPITLTLLNSQGIVITSQQVHAGTGFQEINWPVSKLPAGMYWVKAVINGQQTTQRVLKISD